MPDLTTLDAVRASLALPATQAGDDGVLATLISAVSAAIAAWTRQTFGARVVTETTSGTGGTALLLRQTPVRAVTQVTLDGVVLPPVPGPRSRGWVLADGIYGLLVTAGGATFCRGVQNITVTYEAGFVAAPDEVAHAATRWVARLYRERPRLDERTKSGPGGEATSYDIGDLPAFVALALAPYRRVAP